MYSKVLFLFSLLSVDAATNVYDQSQNGELNIQVDLKDLQIFALLKGQHEEYYEDIDYAYDYSEMTIKPEMNTSKRPLNVMTNSSSTDNVTEMTIKPEIYTTKRPLNVTIDASMENVTEITTKPVISTSQNLLDVTNTDNVTEMSVKSVISTSQKLISVTSSGTSMDNVTEMTAKPQVKTTMNLTSSTSTEYMVGTTVRTLENFKNSTNERDGFLSFFSIFFDPFTSTTISNTQYRLLEPQPRENDGVTTTSKYIYNNMEVTRQMEAIRLKNLSDPVAREPNPLTSNISLTKGGSEYTTKIINPIGSNESNTDTKCKKGFILNQRGLCELKMQTMSNALLKIVKLSQKLKPRKGQDTL